MTGRESEDRIINLVDQHPDGNDPGKRETFFFKEAGGQVTFFFFAGAVAVAFCSLYACVKCINQCTSGDR